MENRRVAVLAFPNSDTPPTKLCEPENASHRMVATD